MTLEIPILRPVQTCSTCVWFNGMTHMCEREMTELQRNLLHEGWCWIGPDCVCQRYESAPDYAAHAAITQGK